MNIYKILFIMLLKKVSELPEKFRQQVTEDLTWWSLANIDEYGNYRQAKLRATNAENSTPSQAVSNAENMGESRKLFESDKEKIK